MLTKFGDVVNGKHENLCNKLMDELQNRHSEIELDHDPDASKTLFEIFLSKVHESILHNRYLRENDMVVVCTLSRNCCGVIPDFSFAKFHQQDVSNWIQNKSRYKPFVNAIPKRDISIHEV